MSPKPWVWEKLIKFLVVPRVWSGTDGSALLRNDSCSGLFLVQMPLKKEVTCLMGSVGLEDIRRFTLRASAVSPAARSPHIVERVPMMALAVAPMPVSGVDKPVAESLPFSFSGHGLGVARAH